MNIVEQKNRKIRDLVNHSHIKAQLLEDKIKWSKICSSMDVIGDTQCAINYYFSLSSFNSYDEGYILIYGLLQSFFLQQDAVSSLSSALFDENSISWKDIECFSVRELRNDSIGHPTDRGYKDNKSFHFIVRPSLSQESFELISHYKENRTYDKKNIFNLKTQQENCIVEILNNIIERMENRNNEHKNKFKGQKILNLIPSSYDIECLKKAHFDESYNTPAYTKNNVQSFKERLKNIQKGIVDRYHELPPSYQEVIEQINHILTKIEEFAESNQILQNKDAEVFLYALDKRFEELKVILENIDNEFS